MKAKRKLVAGYLQVLTVRLTFAAVLSALLLAPTNAKGVVTEHAKQYCFQGKFCHVS